MVASLSQDESYTYTADLLSGPVFFGAIGYALDRWVFHTGPRLVIVGLFVGLLVGMYAIYIRYRRAITALEHPTQSSGATATDTSVDSAAPGIRELGTRAP
ncbi:AtpZ/AtpI family protein [Stomatohabitans albus]|uniref:AtpZ/AtpI family protein n=1 Tax=Stomatohabitans albus TaxID=3110766 RepID=UPI00300D0691